LINDYAVTTLNSENKIRDIKQLRDQVKNAYKMNLEERRKTIDAIHNKYIEYLTDLQKGKNGIEALQPKGLVLPKPMVAAEKRAIVHEQLKIINALTPLGKELAYLNAFQNKQEGKDDVNEKLQAQLQQIKDVNDDDIKVELLSIDKQYTSLLATISID